MAITIQSTPAPYSSIHDDLIYTVAETVKTADPITYPNYKFVADIYVGTALRARIKKVPDPVTGIGIFNIGQIVRNYIATSFNPTANQLDAQLLGDGDFSLTVTVKFGEEYLYTMYTNLTLDTARIYFNNYNGRLIGAATSLTLLDKPLSNRPRTTPLYCEANFNFVPFFPTNTTAFTVRIKTYNHAGALVASIDQAYVPPAAKVLYIFNLSKGGINGLSAGAINDSIKYFTVEFDTPNISDDVIYRFDLDCECIYQVYTVHFLNQYGGFESKDFAKVSRSSVSVDKKDFGKLPYTVNGSGAVQYKNANNVYNETRSVYSSQYKEKITLNSDILTDEEYSWLSELVLSPMVCVEEGGYFFPCVITDSNYDFKKIVNDDFSNLTINIEFGNNLNTQFR